ncbi:MAG: hypothetical protein H0X64_10285 [Gemmatimonadaceae bacterium]|nr:hypothetical protein [Gemmatimonadaceae bacterium]
MVASGVECSGCDASLSVLLQAVGDTVGFLGRDTKGWYVYPGPIRNYETDSLLLVSRLFWGECREVGVPGLLQFATEYDSMGARHRDVFRSTEVRDGRLVDDSVMASPPDTLVVRGAVSRGACREIPPREQAAGF